MYIERGNLDLSANILKLICLMNSVNMVSVLTWTPSKIHELRWIQIQCLIQLIRYKKKCNPVFCVFVFEDIK